MNLEVLHVADCPHLATLLLRLGEVTDLPVVTHQIDTDEDAVSRGMAGSPTLLVDGRDPFAPHGQSECGVSCRIYRDGKDQMTGAPSVEQLRAALGLVGPVEILSSWRTSALPLEPVERAMHQAVVRAFAATGGAPTRGDLDGVTAATGTSTAAVLRRLHDVDAIRLTSDGRIAVAYPFSATPTRHHVRIADQVDTFAMCAIDALGVAAMLGEDTVISSVDVTTDLPVTVTSTAGRTSWEPAGAVVVVGATAAGGPSADCCCDYLNFFTDKTAAESWIVGHPEVVCEVLSQTEADKLGTRLFQPLLAD